MRNLLLVAALVTVVHCAEEPQAQSMREKLRGKVLASLPPAPPPKPAEEKAEGETAPVVMKAVVVSESNRARDLEKLVAREEQKKDAEKFSPVQGGTLVRYGRAELGGWWDQRQGWSFLRVSW